MKIQISRTGKFGRYLNALAWGLTLTGFIGFVGYAIAASGASRWLSEDFEWPSAVSTGVVYVDGHYYVPHPAGRMQVYDEEWNFLHSTYVPSDGGVFSIGRGTDEEIVVHTARGQRVLYYSRSGELLRQRQYDYEYSDTGTTVVVPTSWYLWPFSHPFGFWLIAAVGILLNILLDKIRK